MSRKILLFSRDTDFCVLLSHVLSTKGYVTSIFDTNVTRDEADFGTADAILLDSHQMLESALALCGDLRARLETHTIPIIALIRACNEHHFLDLIRAGVTECLVRPVSPDVIIACLEAALGADRADGLVDGKGSILAVGGLELHHGSRSLKSASSVIQLSPTEYRLLRYMVSNAGRLSTRAELIAAAWPAGIHVEARTVDVHMGRLRRMLERSSGRKMIRTIRSAGFIFED